MPLDKPIAVIQYPSLMQWLVDRMVGAIALHPAFDRSLDLMALPLFKTGDRTFGTFSSPLLLQLSRGTEISRVQALGEEILDIFRSEIGDGRGLRDSALAPPAPQVLGEITEDLGYFPPNLATVYTQVLESVEGRYTSPPTPPSLGGNVPKLWISPPRIGGSGGLMQGVQKKSDLCVHGSPGLGLIGKGQRALPISPKFWITPTGWLYTKFSPNDLTTWLQSLIKAKPILRLDASSEISNINPKISADPVLFNLQHAHARCHSLLHLAGQEKFLPLEELDQYFEAYGPSLWQTENGALHLQTKAEQAVLLALMQFPQSLSPQKVTYGCAYPKQAGYETRVLWPLPPKHLYRQAIAWSQLFSDFHRDCRLFGAVQKNTPQLAHARFALVYIVKNVLAFLLEDILHVGAPLAL